MIGEIKTMRKSFFTLDYHFRTQIHCQGEGLNVSILGI